MHRGVTLVDPSPNCVMAQVNRTHADCVFSFASHIPGVSSSVVLRRCSDIRNFP